MLQITINNDSSRSQIQHVIYVLILLGIALHLKTAFWESSEPVSGFSIGLLVWSVIPYFVIFIFRNSVYGALCAAVAVFAFDIWIHLEAFVFPSSSTAALGLLFMPLWNLFLVIPLSFFIDSLITKRIGRK